MINATEHRLGANLLQIRVGLFCSFDNYPTRCSQKSVDKSGTSASATVLKFVESFYADTLVNFQRNTESTWNWDCDFPFIVYCYGSSH